MFLCGVFFIAFANVNEKPYLCKLIALLQVAVRSVLCESGRCVKEFCV